MAVEYASRAEVRSRRREAADVASFVRRLDWLLVGAVAALVGYGLWAINGITQHDVPGNPNYYLVRQSLFVGAGAACLLVAVIIDPAWYRRHWRLIFGGTTGVIVLVLLAGSVTRGSRRWLDLGAFRFQPSEFGKVFFVLALAGFLAERTKRIGEPRAVRPRFLETLTAPGVVQNPGAYAPRLADPSR